MTGAQVTVCLVAPSSRQVGGQSVVAGSIASQFAGHPKVAVLRCDIDTNFRSVFRVVSRIPVLRTLVNECFYFVRLFRCIRRSDVVHVMSASYWSFLLSTVPAILVGRLLGRPVLLNYHSGEADDHYRHWSSARYFTRLVDAVVVPSKYLSDVLSSHGFASDVVHNSVDESELRYRQRSAPGPKLMSNRSFEAHYNVLGLLESYRRVLERHPDATLALAGDGPQRSMLEAYVEEHALDGVRFVGAVPPSRMAELYDEADVFLNASLIDNMPMSLLEAAVSGLPVISSDAGGIPVMLNAEDGVLLTEAGDAESFAMRVSDLLDGKYDLAALTATARRSVLERYGVDASRRRWESAYLALAGCPETAEESSGL